MIKEIRKLNIFRRGPAPYGAKGSRSGFALLYAVMISSIILVITLGIMNISLKEIKFSTSAKDTNDAFFAADTGAECALYNDKSTGSVFTDPNSPSITCNNITFTANEGPTLYWSFIVPGLGSGGQGCAKVTVDKTGLCGSAACIISRGYNNGGASCLPGSSTVERELDVSY